MTDPITPPPELLKHWEDLHFDEGENYDVMLIQAYQAGADQELIACGNYLKQCAAWEEEDVIEFYNYRRPKPPSLKEQALADLDKIESSDRGGYAVADLTAIRRALEALPE